MKTKTYILFFILSFLACNQKDEIKPEIVVSATIPASQFDKTKWAIKEDKDYPYRESMLDDIMNTRMLKRLNKDEILDLLGEPTRIDSNYLFYMVTQKRLGFWPLTTHTLVIRLSQDTSANAVMIHGRRTKN